MDISIMDAFNVMGAVAVPVAGYLGYIQKRVGKLEVTLPKEYLAKEDYRDDMSDIKETLREMRGDIKAILGVPQ
jgi:hypothetical protein